ncbi:hypothetical protein [Solirubrobacter deserti]|uniref:Uncharacterized protein n=1 Tax=Solirubrobacter deserti TaxID=2282478 RepID=A0ABT4RQT5_9ACTN|nr:hypothetical protein [Solirubrobacter deserti]MDA0140932.1 hypothetical protein [Solirubrobacter deserti]
MVGEQRVGELEPRLSMVRTWTPTGLEGGQAVKHRPDDLCPGPIAVREGVLHRGERAPQRLRGVVGRKGQPDGIENIAS